MISLFVLLVGLVGPHLCQAQPTLKADHPKFRATKQVFDDIVEAVGDGRTPPQLRLLPRDINSRIQVAWFAPGPHVLFIEERVYDLCAELGADSLNALASLIGHELAHFYKDHKWVGDFSNGFADLEVGRRLRELRRAEDRMMEFEAEADDFGGFYGFLAGYNTLAIAPSLLSEIYAEYELGSDLRGYPALAERQEIALRSQEDLRELIPVFEAGKRLLLLSQYDNAARCFEFVAREFPSREILNNLGVSRALAAIDLFGEDELRFAYPLELDAGSRLYEARETRSAGFAGADEERRNGLLTAAKAAFTRARERDAEYPPALVNLACVVQLQGFDEDAEFFARQALKLAKGENDRVSRANALIIRGIARATRTGSSEEAETDFSEAIAGNRSLAEVNLAILRGGTGALSPPREMPSLRREMAVGDGTPEYVRLVAEASTHRQLRGSGQGQTDLLVIAGSVDEWEGLIVETDKSLITFMSTAKGFGGRTARGIVVGSSASEVRAAYGDPARLIATRQGTFLVYRKTPILFDLDAADAVRGWVLYSDETEFVAEVAVAEKAAALQPIPAEPRHALEGRLRLIHCTSNGTLKKKKTRPQLGFRTNSGFTGTAGPDPRRGRGSGAYLARDPRSHSMPSK